VFRFSLLLQGRPDLLLPYFEECSSLVFSFSIEKKIIQKKKIMCCTGAVAWGYLAKPAEHNVTYEAASFHKNTLC
jgi:hypothetical protein